MERPPIVTICWLSIISGIALMSCALSSPVGSLQAPDARVIPNSLSRKLTPSPDDPGVVLSSAKPGGAFIGADRAEIIEEDEDKSYFSFCRLASPAFIASDGTSKILSGPHPGNPPSRTVSVPLRC